MNTPGKIDSSESDAADKFTVALAELSTRQCIANVACNAHAEPASHLALRIATPTETAIDGERVAVVNCPKAECGVLLRLADATIETIGCQHYEDGTIL